MEDVNFPLDQGQVSSALRGLRESGEESSRPRRLEDSGEGQRNTEETSDDEVEQTARAERTVIREDRVDETEPTRRQDERPADVLAKDQEVEIRDSTTIEEQEGITEENLEPLEVAREVGIDPRGGVPTQAEQVNEGFRTGNDLTNPDAVDEFTTADQVDSVEEGAQRANEEAASRGQEDPARPLEGQPSIREVVEGGRPPQGQERIDEGFNSDPPSPEERAAATLEQAPPVDAKVQQRIQDERAAEAEFRAENEPALETPEQSIDPVEEPEEPLKEAVDNNPLRGPRPSELRDESDATERGQNVSNLI